MPESHLHRVLRRAVNEAIHRGWYQLRAFGAIAPGTNLADRFGTFGDSSIIAFPTSALFGEPHIHIGEGTLIAPWATLSAGYSPEQTDVPDRALVIGDRCVIGMRCGSVAHQSIEIGEPPWLTVAAISTAGPDGNVTCLPDTDARGSSER